MIHVEIVDRKKGTKPMNDVKNNFHFNPPSGWMNDPNGLIYIDGTYHIFYQHYPDDTKWGPMHWGHAISKDLKSFEHLPIALYPREDEYVFSGSAVLDTENVSGLGRDGKSALLLFYTGHNPITGEQQQCLAYSTDYVNFKRFAFNPIILNINTDYLSEFGIEFGDATESMYSKFKPDFRDPKVVANAIKGGYTMVLAAGEKIEFYHSLNLLDWSYTGEFVTQYTICECPDLIKFDVKNDESGEVVTKYTLIMSYVEPAVEDAEEKHGNIYYIGDFDGDKFICDQNSGTQKLDYGRDFYAATSFAGTDEPIIMAWGEDWNQARENTAKDFFGKLTLARKLKLVKIDGDYKIAQEPIVDEDKISIVEHEGKEYKVIKDNGYVEAFADGGCFSYSQNLDN